MKIFIADAFTQTKFSGNPAAVCLVETEMTDREMQSIANEMNLSETAFVIRAGERYSYSLRWFTPKAEVDLCGHATLASAHILWSEGIHVGNEIQFETKSGILSAVKKEGWIQLDFPLEPEQPCQPPTELITGLETSFIYTGKNRMDYLVEVPSQEIVEKLQPDFTVLKKLDCRGIIVTSRSNEEHVDFVSRCFFPGLGVNEDPVTGSAHCCLGPFWKKKLKKSALSAKQLSMRGGMLRLNVRDQRILISGHAVTVLRGELENGRTVNVGEIR